MLLNQSSAIHTKSGCNKEERLTQLLVPADYLVTESGRGIQSMSPHRALKRYPPHTSYLHPYHRLQCSTVSSNHEDEAVPAMPESRTCSPDHNMTEINVLQLRSAPPSSPSHSVLPSLIAPINPVSPSQGC